MTTLTPKMVVWLERLSVQGTWPSAPFLRDQESAAPLMRMGLVYVVHPAGPYLPYAAVTKAGREKLAALGMPDLFDAA